MVKPIRTHTRTVINYVDSIAWHDSTVVVYLQKEKDKDITKLTDTLKLETTYAQAEAYVDTTTATLKGSIQNKDIPIRTQIKWKEKIVYRDSIEIVEKEIPVVVEKEVVAYPSSYWWFAGFTVMSVLWAVIKEYIKLKK